MESGGGGREREKEPIDPIDQHLATVHLRQLSTNIDGSLGARGALPKVHTTFLTSLPPLPLTPLSPLPPAGYRSLKLAGETWAQHGWLII